MTLANGIERVRSLFTDVLRLTEHTGIRGSEEGSMTTGMSWIDFKIGWRMLVKYPALSLVGGLGMAVGIAVSVGFFAFIGAHFFGTVPSRRASASSRSRTATSR
jgi:hypothetical protein